MIKAILFDFDGVLTIDKYGSSSIIKYISQRTGIPLELVKSGYYKYNKQLLLGELTHKDMWKDFCDELGQKIDYQILIEAFEGTGLDAKMIDYIKELKKRYLIGMITDNKIDRIEVVLTANHLEEFFDVVAISADVHSRKDNQPIFQYALDKLCVQATECIFVDNTADNLLLPKEIGMKTILFDDESRDIEAFRESINVILNYGCM